MDVKEQIGNRIKTLRTARGYSQERLAEIIGVNSKYLSSVERGKENPTLDFLIRLSSGLQVSVQEMFYVQNVGENPKVMRRRIKALIDDANDADLIRVLRVVEGLIRP